MTGKAKHSRNIRKAAICVIGAGRMGSALIRAFISKKLFRPEQIIAADADGGKLEVLERQTGVMTSHSNPEAVSAASVVLLCVKPNAVVSVLTDIRSSLRPAKLVISIAAGVRIGTIQKHLGTGARVIRAMPNTPCLVGEGAIVFSRGRTANKRDAAFAHRLFSATGICFELDESLLDAVTGLSGSGPAYIYTVIEALSEGGVEMGLPADVAARLSAQTVLGASKMVLSTGRNPAELREQVTSPGGTTIEGLKALESAHVKKAFVRAVRAAALKSKQLSRMSSC